MIVRDILVKYEKESKKLSLENSAIRILVAHVLKINLDELVFYLNSEVDELNFYNLFSQYQSGKPVQYLTSSVSFFNRDFYVDERVLIPRFETEELVDIASKEIIHFFGQKKLNCCEVGVGSGVIAITMMDLNPNLAFVGVDISKNALAVAKINSNKHDKELRLVHGSVFEPIEQEKFDVIISNPPYISRDGYVEKKVVSNEPHEALFADNDGMAIYEEIFKNIYEVCNEQALIFFEIGYDQKEKIEALAKKYLKDYTCEIKKDLQGHNRIVIIKLMR